MRQSVSAGDGPRIDLPRRQLVIVTIGVLTSMMLFALDSSIVATAMPRIISELSGLQFYAWVTTAYLVTSTTIIPISGKLGDLFGRKRFLQAGTIGFLATSALCGFAQTMPQLVAARGLQGLFGGMLTSSAIASIADLYMPATRARMQGVFASVFAVANIAGPIVGGILADTVGWRYIFYVNVLLGLVASLIVAKNMPTMRTSATWRSIDVRGALLLAAGLAPLLIGLTATREFGWTSPLVLALFAAAVVLLILFVFAELRVPNPIMPLRLFRIPAVSVSVAVSFLAAFGMFGSNLYVPLLYQGLLGLSATQSGLLLAPRMFGMVAASLTSGQLVTRITRYRFVGAAGLVLLAAGLFVLSRITTESTELTVVGALVLLGLGFGSNQPIYQNVVMSAVPFEYVGVASSQVQFWRSLGQTMGVAVLGAVLASQVAGPTAGETVSAISPELRPALAEGLRSLFLVATVAVAIAVVVSLQLPEVPFRRRGQARTAVADTIASPDPATTA
ncbi:MAG TPA: MDR family MFS transporter [Candidatus Acidoferrales bacterium]|nr:MDR family MFS transporter [Candidatus Acidoferrales bacterium]